MSDLYVPTASAIGLRLDDAPHRLAVAFLAHPAPESPSPNVVLTAGWAVALIAVESGKVLAWDGWYGTDLEEQRLPLDGFEGVDFDEWDNAPSRLVVECMRPWMRGPVAEWLAPTFSPAREAASLFASHFDSADGSATRRELHDAAVVAYLPVIDEDVLVAEVDRIEGRLTFSHGEIGQALASELRALNQREQERD